MQPRARSISHPRASRAGFDIGDAPGSRPVETPASPLRSLTGANALASKPSALPSVCAVSAVQRGESADMSGSRLLTIQQMCGLLSRPGERGGRPHAGRPPSFNQPDELLAEL
jgi:hypothetical protein